MSYLRIPADLRAWKKGRSRHPKVQQVQIQRTNEPIIFQEAETI